MTDGLRPPPAAAEREEADVPSATRLDLSRRDLTLDLVRVVCVLMVVVIHTLQVGIGIAPDGAIVSDRPLEAQPWFAHATWAGQIMPLFFVVGGFAAATGWDSWRQRGGDAAGFVRTRVLRLAQPALALFVFVAVVLAAVTAAGLAPELVQAAAVAVGLPLWFLAAYLITQGAAPLHLRLHRRAPVATLVVTVLLVVAVDVGRFMTGVSEIGLCNLVFVWLAAQQIGFFLRDGWFEARHPLVLVAIAAAGYLSLWPLTTVAPYSADLLAMLNPPTLPLVVLAVAQTCLLRLLRRPLTAVMRTRAARGAVFVAGSRLMTIYLWHLPAILIVAGVALLIPGAAPAPASPAWWWSRPLVLVAALGIVLLASIPLSRVEAVRPALASPPVAVVALAWACCFAPPFAVLQWHMNVAFAVGGAVLLAAGVCLLRLDRRGVTSPRTPGASA